MDGNCVSLVRRIRPELLLFSFYFVFRSCSQTICPSKWFLTAVWSQLLRSRCVCVFRFLFLLPEHIFYALHCFASKYRTFYATSYLFTLLAFFCCIRWSVAELCLCHSFVANSPDRNLIHLHMHTR